VGSSAKDPNFPSRLDLGCHSCLVQADAIVEFFGKEPRKQFRLFYEPRLSSSFPPSSSLLLPLTTRQEKRTTTTTTTTSSSSSSDQPTQSEVVPSSGPIGMKRSSLLHHHSRME